jgi:hypothetical protein
MKLGFENDWPTPAPHAGARPAPHARKAMTSARVNQAVVVAVIVAFAALAMASKESGVTVAAAVPALMAYRRRARGERVVSPSDVVLLAPVAALLVVYFWLRSRSGAVSPGSSEHEAYNYAWSFTRGAGNLLRYGWRTYGLLAILACALLASERLRGSPTPQTSLLPWRELSLSPVLFALSVAPFVLLPGRSAIYSYLPGAAAALMLGGLACAVRKSSRAAPPLKRILAACPVVIVVASYAVVASRQVDRWALMGEASRRVLEQIAAQQPAVAPGTFFLLRYSEQHEGGGFPEAFGNGGFPLALRVLYGDPTLKGALLRCGEPTPAAGSAQVLEIEYYVDVGGRPTVEIIRPMRVDVRDGSPFEDGRRPPPGVCRRPLVSAPAGSSSP